MTGPAEWGAPEVLESMAAALRDFHRAASNSVRAQLEDVLDEHGLYIAGINAPEVP